MFFVNLTRQSAHLSYYLSPISAAVCANCINCLSVTQTNFDLITSNYWATIMATVHLFDANKRYVTGTKAVVSGRNLISEKVWASRMTDN